MNSKMHSFLHSVAGKAHVLLSRGLFPSGFLTQPLVVVDLEVLSAGPHPLSPNVQDT